jgi:hypothetical protein
MVHGVFPGGELSAWEDEMVSHLEKRGVVAAQLRYRMLLPEYFLGTVMIEQAARITSAVAVLNAAHARTQCPAPFRVAGVGHSAGTRILLESALQGTHFRRLTFNGSPIFFASSDVGAVLTDRRVEHLVNYHSLMDGFVWPMLPMGIWGYGGDGLAWVDNRFTLELHGFPYVGVREELSDEIALALTPQGEVHTCERDATFVELTREVVKSLETR